MKINFRAILIVVLLACATFACSPSSATHVTPTEQVAVIQSTATRTRIPSPTLIPSETPMPIGTPAPLEPLAPPKKLLIIGNSISFWNDGIDFHLKELLNSADPPISIEIDTCYKGEANLEMQWKVSNARAMIAKGGYDVVILQEQSNANYNWPSFSNYTRKFNAEIRSAGSIPVLYMPNPFLGKGSVDEMIQAHSDIATELGLHVAPVALAWLRIAKEDPDFNLYDEDDPYVEYLGGQVHPNIQGTYLGINILFATLFGVSPEGLSYIPKGMTEVEAAFLQRIAWETVTTYQAERVK